MGGIEPFSFEATTKQFGSRFRSNPSAVLREYVMDKMVKKEKRSKRQ